MAHNPHIKHFVKVAANCLTFAVLFSVYFSSLHVSTRVNARSAGEVYCPLQKTWVRKDLPAAVTDKQKEPLKNICATEQSKSNFYADLFSGLRYSNTSFNDRETEGLFFSYTEEGKTAFAKVLSSRQDNDPQIVRAARAEKGSMADKTSVTKRSVETLSPTMQPRPPTTIAEDNFSFQFIAELKNISRSIAPRAPPVSV
jgi:hypothetical protein